MNPGREVLSLSIGTVRATWPWSFRSPFCYLMERMSETEAEQRPAESRGGHRKSEDLAWTFRLNHTSKSWLWVFQLGEPINFLWVVCLCERLKMATKSLIGLSLRCGVNQRWFSKPKAYGRESGRGALSMGLCGMVGGESSGRTLRNWRTRCLLHHVLISYSAFRGRHCCSYPNEEIKTVRNKGQGCL